MKVITRKPCRPIILSASSTPVVATLAESIVGPHRSSRAWKKAVKPLYWETDQHASAAWCFVVVLQSTWTSRAPVLMKQPMSSLGLWRAEERKVLCPYRYAAVGIQLQPVTEPISVQATIPYHTDGEANQSRNATTDRRFLAFSSTEMRVDRDD